MGATSVTGAGSGSAEVVSRCINAQGQIDLLKRGIGVSPGPGGSVIYTNTTPVPVTLGGVDAGHTFDAETVQQVFDELFYPVLDPSFASFSISGQPTVVEVGTTISGSKTFVWSTVNPTSVVADSVAIRDETASTTLAQSLADDGTETLTLAPVQKTSATTNQWRVQATSSKGGQISRLFAVAWQWRVYYGTSGNTTLDEPGIKSLTNQLQAVSTGTYIYGTGGYKFLAVPSVYPAPAMFMSGSFQVAMAENVDDPFFSNVSGGFYYGLVSVTNGQGQTTNYRVYRTKNILGGTLVMVVT